jgi:hypothetical protein
MTHFDDLTRAVLRGSVRKKETAPMPGAERRLVLVLGPGRSGTSTMAGVLAHCGYVVPDPIEPEESNPAGFYEPRWVNEFHLELLERADVRPLDSDPGAAEVVSPLMAEADVRKRLRGWLEEQLDQHERLIVKDPRLVWFRDLWVSVAEELGQEPASVVMLRHPSEVSSSRSEVYHSRLTTAVVGWVNVALLAERVTRGSARAVVPYADLIVDWRAPLTRVRDSFGLRLDPDVDTKPHPADDFVDPGLRRHFPGWEDSTVPLHVRTLADAVFEALDDVVRDDVPARAARLDALHDEYTALHAGAFDVVRHQVMRERRQFRRFRRQAKQLAPGDPWRRSS